MFHVLNVTYETLKTPKRKPEATPARSRTFLSTGCMLSSCPCDFPAPRADFWLCNFHFSIFSSLFSVSTVLVSDILSHYRKQLCLILRRETFPSRVAGDKMKHFKTQTFVRLLKTRPHMIMGSNLCLTHFSWQRWMNISVLVYEHAGTRLHQH